MRKPGFTIKRFSKNKNRIAMKKAAFIFILSLSVLGSGAQHLTERFRPVYSVHTPKFGIVGGPQFSNFHDEAVGSPNALFGFHFGLAYSMPVSKRISFEPQLVYSKKGGAVDYAHAAYYYYDGTLRYRLHYLEMPLLFNIHTKNILDFVVGGYVDYLADATFNVATPLGYGYGELDYGDFEKLDFGLTGGLAFNFPFRKITLKYSYGFNKVANDNSAYVFLEGAKNSTFSISFTRYLK
ncbi:porin family protein [Maribellus comscasis]|nr:porin family protein [Maribellus comscasis]